MTARTIPSSRLLVFDVKQGWDPLSRFLGKTVPETPFPPVKERENFGKDLPKGSGTWWALSLHPLQHLRNALLQSTEFQRPKAKA